ncbi:hypothetical protein [Streptomyces sp. ME18-1-4]|uniref:hypothetical protein n=1 Tax=Streptomyces sp. ME18-1-4 TaxID=3028685 RepID=UPI0029CA5B3B|nr:hypothetical protein [Streptomyces sp. ME18-1-4]
MAGRDEELRAALDDLRLGRWSAMRDLLRKTGGDWALRTARSQVFAVGAGDGGAVKAWLEEEPFSADALMMWARVLTRQALRALRDGKDDYLVRRVGGVARDACFSALGRRPEDPVVWVCLLDLAKLLDLQDLRYLDPYFGQRPRPHLWGQAPEIGLFPGPWPLLDEVNLRDPGNREGYHRMREYFGMPESGVLAVDFARWASAGAPRGSVLHVLPLYEFVAEYKRRHGGGQGTAIAFWGREQVKHHARKARDDWFEATPRTLRARLSLLDLNHLAYALVACGEDGAGEVFEEIGPYATRTPWEQVSASLRRDWQNEFRRMRDSSVRRRVRHR